MKVIIFVALIFLVRNFGMHAYRQGDRQIPPITVLAAIVLFVIMLII